MRAESTNTLRAILYARTSTSHHEQRPELQLELLRDFARARGWTVVNEIVDHGYSGGTDQRPGLKKLMEAARNRECDLVCTLKLDRLFRSLRHLVVTLEEFHALKVSFVALKDNVDYTTPAGRLLVQVLGALGEFEKGIARERTLLGLAHARSRGIQLGRPPRGLTDEIRRLRAAGKSLRAIAKELSCSVGTVHRVLYAVQ